MHHPSNGLCSSSYSLKVCGLLPPLSVCPCGSLCVSLALSPSTSVSVVSSSTSVSVVLLWFVLADHLRLLCRASFGLGGGGAYGPVPTGQSPDGDRCRYSVAPTHLLKHLCLSCPLLVWGGPFGSPAVALARASFGRGGACGPCPFGTSPLAG